MIRFNHQFDAKECVMFDEEGKQAAIELNPDYNERSAEQWIAYQIGNLDVKEQSIDFIIEDAIDGEQTALNVTYQRFEPEMTLSTTCTKKARQEAILITYPIVPEQRWQDVPVHLANDRTVFVTLWNDKERLALLVIAEILVKASPKALFLSTLDWAVRIDTTTHEVTTIFGVTDDERNLLSARICDRVAQSRLLAAN